MKYGMTVDISDVTKACEASKAEVAEFPAYMKHELAQAAMTERFTHRYRNQTGHLQNSTGAGVISETDNRTVVDLEMSEEYASHVVRRGYSRFPKIADETARRIQARAEAIARRASRR